MEFINKETNEKVDIDIDKLIKKGEKLRATYQARKLFLLPQYKYKKRGPTYDK